MNEKKKESEMNNRKETFRDTPCIKTTFNNEKISDFLSITWIESIKTECECRII